MKLMKKTVKLLALLLLTATAACPQVTYDRLRAAAREPQNWLTYSGGYSSWRYSTLDQINPRNASRLSLQWAFQVGDLGQFETTPLVVDGVLYGTGQNDRAFALDARTGRAIWRYQRTFPTNSSPAVAWSIAALPFWATGFSWPPSMLTSSPSTPKPEICFGM